MIIEVEDWFCKAAKAFSEVLRKLKQAAKRSDAVHEVEETTWFNLIEMGREMIAGYIKRQENIFREHNTQLLTKRSRQRGWESILLFNTFRPQFNPVPTC